MRLAYCTQLERLVNLLVLEIEGRRRLQSLHDSFSDMENLTELKMLRCDSLTGMPRGIGKLSDLQKVAGWAAVDGHGSATFQYLQTLINLEELRLQNLKSMSDPEDAPTAKLHEKSKLKHLALHWTVDDEVEMPFLLLQILEGLRPNPTLEKLEISCYLGDEFPRWMRNLRSSVEIRLTNLRNCTSLPALRQLPNLVIDEIRMPHLPGCDNSFSVMLRLERRMCPKIQGERILFSWTTRVASDAMSRIQRIGC